MSVVLVVGVGAVGTRAARQLIDTPGVEALLIADRDSVQAARVADALGPTARVVDFEPGARIPDDVDVIATAVPAEADHAIVTAAIQARVPLASSTDEHEAVEQLRALDMNARGAGTTIA